MWWCSVKFVSDLSWARHICVLIEYAEVLTCKQAPGFPYAGKLGLPCEEGQERESWTAEKGTDAELLWTNHSSWETTEELNPKMQTAPEHQGLCWEASAAEKAKMGQ